MYRYDNILSQLKTRRGAIIGGLIVIVVIITAYLVICHHEIYDASQSGVAATPQPLTAVLMFTGDLMCVYETQNMAVQGDIYDVKAGFDYVKPILAESDLTIGNLETVLSPSAPYRHEQTMITSPDGLQQNCNAAATYLEALVYAGFSAVVTANNHNLDAGLVGIAETLDNLERYHLPHTGMFKGKNDSRFLLADINGINIALLSYATAFNTFDRLYSTQELNIHINKYDQKKAALDIATAKKEGADYVIVFIHWGMQNSTSVTKNQLTYAQQLADSGADYIVGGHPHVLNPYDICHTPDGRNVPVLYSLGNFFTDMNEIEYLNRDAVIWRLELKKDSSAAIIADESYIPCHIFLDFEGQHCVTVPCNTQLANTNARRELETARERIRRALGDKTQEFRPLKQPH